MKSRWFVALLLVLSFAVPAFAQYTDSERAQGSSMVAPSAVTPNAITARRYPLAYGFVMQNGTKTSGTANWTVKWNPTSMWYEITITGKAYYYSTYATMVTVSVPRLTACYTDSVSGKLLVRCYTASGNPTPVSFGFGVF